MKDHPINPAWDTATHTMMVPDFTRFDFKPRPKPAKRKSRRLGPVIHPSELQSFLRRAVQEN